MTTKRRPIHRGLKIRITEEMVALYRRGKELRQTRLDHIRGTCPGPVNEHCADCRESIEKSLELHRLLNLNPWDRSPVDDLAEDERPPSWLCAGKSFNDVREIKRQLEKAGRAR